MYEIFIKSCEEKNGCKLRLHFLTIILKQNNRHSKKTGTDSIEMHRNSKKWILLMMIITVLTTFPMNCEDLQHSHGGMEMSTQSKWSPMS